MLQQEGPDDYVIASGEQHSVREFVEQAFRVAGIEIEWRGSGPNEVAVAVGGTLAGEPAKGRTLVRIDPRYLRPTEVDTLLGDASKARTRLGWRPRVGFEALVAEMIEADLREAERDHLVKSSGYPVYARHE
jgi:GDPmannose 4,6-dehydratase